MTKKTLALIIGLVVITIVLFVIALGAGRAHAWENNSWYPIPTLPVCNADHKKNCVTPTPIIPSPTKGPNCGNDEVWEPCPTTSPTPTPTATPSASPTQTATPSANTGDSSGGGQSNNPPPVAQCANNSFVGPVIVAFTDKGNGTVNFAWTEITGGINKYSMIYGYSPDALVYGQDNIPGNVWNWDIHDLAVGSHVWAKVIAWQNGCAVYSNLFDPIVR